MEQNSEVGQMLGSQHHEQTDTPPPRFNMYPRSTPATQGSGNAEPTFSPLMLQQMKSMIDGVLESAIDRRLTAMGVNLTTPTSHLNPLSLKGGKGAMERENIKMLIKPQIRRSSRIWQLSYLRFKRTEDLPIVNRLMMISTEMLTKRRQISLMRLKSKFKINKSR